VIFSVKMEKINPHWLTRWSALQVLIRKTARGSIELKIGRTLAGVLREEETEKLGEPRVIPEAKIAFK
jgi:hypothetical protein